MTSVITAWAISAGLLLLGTAGAGLRVRDRGLTGPSRILGIFIDDRGRYSLTRFQIALWSILVISVISGLFFGRLAGGLAAAALDFKIPPELLAAMGISAGSTAAATAVKASKNATNPGAVAAGGPVAKKLIADADAALAAAPGAAPAAAPGAAPGADGGQGGNAGGDPKADPEVVLDAPRWTQMLMREEGDMADKVIDIAKFQNFWITLFLVGAYALLVMAAISKAKTVGDFALPGFSATFLTLLGISHAGYIAGKLPNQSGIPDGLSVLAAQDPDEFRKDPVRMRKLAKRRN